MLDSILEYEMTTQQGVALRLALMWIALNRKEFPNRRCVKLRKTGDPRKSMLFRHCLKLIQETQGLIKPEEYKLYILAQLRMVGKLEADGVHALIEPSILTGPKAWKRWKIWKWHYDRRMKQTLPDTKEMNNIIPPIIIIQQLKKTRDFLEKELNIISETNIETLIKTGKLKEWLKLDKISPFYIILSPFISSIVSDINEVFDKDFTIYQQSITSEIKGEFETIFQYKSSHISNS